MKDIELKDFIKATLKDIIDGVHTASIEISQDRGLIAPTVSNEIAANIDYDIRIVEFDVAVTATEGADNEIKAGIKILGFGKEFSKENTYAQRIKFSIPIGIKKGQDRTYNEQHERRDHWNKSPQRTAKVI